METLERRVFLGIRLFFILSLALFVLHIGYELVSMLFIDFPFNGYEPEVIMDAWALSIGEPLYPSRLVGPPAGLYAPGYHIVLALLFKILPNTIVIGRIVSLLSIVGIAIIVQKRLLIPRSFWLSLLLLLLWHNMLVGFDFHAKPDSFSVLMGIVSVYWIMNADRLNIQHILLSAIFASLAVATKQSMLFVAVGIGLSLLVTRKFKETFYFGLLFFISSAALWSIFTYTLGDDLWFYVFIQPGSFAMRWGDIFINFWMIQNNPLWIITILTIVAILKAGRINYSIILLLIITLLALPASVLTASKGGGMSNAYQPFYYFMTWLLLILFSSNWKEGFMIEKWFSTNRTLIFTLATLILWFTWSPNIPSIITSVNYRVEIFRNYNQLANELNNADGNVYSAYDNYITLKAGKPIRWSRKWGAETDYSDLKSIKRKTYASNVHQVNHVITIQNNGWISEANFEKNLENNGFILKKSFQLGQSDKYYWWTRSTDSTTSK